MNLHSQVDKRLLQAFVPVNGISSEHLEELAAKQAVDVAVKGQTLFQLGDSDDATLYLLEGEVELVDVAGNRQYITAGGLDSWHPIGHFQPRRHTCTALTDITFVRIDNFRLDTLLSWDQSIGYVILDITSDKSLADDADWMIQLLHSNLFFKIPPANIRELFKRMQPKNVAAGETIIKQGENGDCCYFIKRGIAQVIRSQGVESQLLAELSIGQSFGEDALLAYTTRNASVIMQTDGVVMQLARKDFDELLRAPVVDEVSFNDALDMIASGAIFLDVRLEEEYEQGHFPTTANMPLSLLRLK
ncbi:MAG TPA: cyclic nucleotide-binding domain-containing protein, partial [Pseudomonadales bacterium]|nr:cyclic nucleotide-binding domain-containing protein [Pseudomonadales bacterium]